MAALPAGLHFTPFAIPPTAASFTGSDLKRARCPDGYKARFTAGLKSWLDSREGNDSTPLNLGSCLSQLDCPSSTSSFAKLAGLFTS